MHVGNEASLAVAAHHVNTAGAHQGTRCAAARERVATWQVQLRPDEGGGVQDVQVMHCLVAVKAPKHQHALSLINHDTAVPAARRGVGAAQLHPSPGGQIQLEFQQLIKRLVLRLPAKHEHAAPRHNRAVPRARLRQEGAARDDAAPLQLVNVQRTHVVEELAAAVHLLQRHPLEQRHTHRNPATKHHQLLHRQLLCAHITHLVQHLAMEKTLRTDAANHKAR
mmetsp:Transcript_44812/g.116035  ORF Transcript_44812/g.116035 Transcript_44812/m.116035 type:complete len:223 (+) Transcript_44812:927-1595(+)